MKILKYGFVFFLLVVLSPMVIGAEQAMPINNHTVTNAPGASIFNALCDHNEVFNWKARTQLDLGARDTTELFWDDGDPEGYYLVSFPPGANDRFGVRFSLPSAPPLKVVSGRFYTDNSSIPLKSFSVCLDAGGYPDVFHPIDQVDTVIGGYPGWGSYDFHGAVFDSADIWAVVNWIPGYVTGIGADSTAPDGNSYWCNNRDADNWTQWMATDWLMRLSVATVTDSHDVTAVSMLEPPGRFLPGDTAHPTVVFGNCGHSSETFDVYFIITDSAGSAVYTSSSAISLLSGQVETLTFVPDWIELDEGMYDYKAYTSLAGDADPANDTVRMQGLCTREIIITYCGDYTNMGEAIIGTWATDRKFLVRMTPPVPPPFYLRRAQVFLCDGFEPLEYVCVHPDNGSGLPDTATVLAIANNVQTTQDLSWATADYGEIEVNYPGDLWMVARWREGITEPHIGLETNNPSTERSWRYYFRYGAGHYENMGVDPYFREWYFRLIIAVPATTGAAEYTAASRPVTELECSPNPSSGQTVIKYAAGGPAGSPCIKIFDSAGRLVKTLPLPAAHSATQHGGVPPAAVFWDGRDDSGQRLGSGVYFVKLEADGQNLTEKLILLR